MAGKGTSVKTTSLFFIICPLGLLWFYYQLGFPLLKAISASFIRKMFVILRK